MSERLRKIKMSFVDRESSFAQVLVSIVRRKKGKKRACRGVKVICLEQCVRVVCVCVCVCVCVYMQCCRTMTFDGFDLGQEGGGQTLSVQTSNF